MSKNNQIRRSDKKFIRREKARIRAQFLDAKKQKELIDELYKKFLTVPIIKQAEIAQEEKPKAKTEIKKKDEKTKIKKQKIKKT